MKNEIYDAHKSSIGGLDANIVALLAYFISTILLFVTFVKYAAWVAPLIIFFLEKDSKFVKFHAMQSFLLNVIGAILGSIISLFGSIFIVGKVVTGSAIDALEGGIYYSIVIMAIFIVMIVLSVMAIVGAYNYKEVHLPIIGEISSKFSSK